MSANIYWTPVKEKKNDISVGAPSSFIGTLSEAFGPLPLTLEDNETTIATLHGMLSAARDNEFGRTYGRIIDALAKYHKIKIWAEY